MRPRLKRRAQNAASADPHGAGLKVAVIAGVIVLAVTALVFSSSFTTRDVAEDGVIALQSESALGANDVAFKALGQVVLLAPDMDAEIFATMLPRIRPIMEGLTIYVSGTDRPLALSEQLHGYARLGQAGNDVSTSTIPRLAPISTCC